MTSLDELAMLGRVARIRRLLREARTADDLVRAEMELISLQIDRATALLKAEAPKGRRREFPSPPA